MKKNEPTGIVMSAKATGHAVKNTAYKIYAFVVMFLLVSPLFSQPALSGSQGQGAASDAEISPLYQKIYNILSVVVVIAAIVYIVKPIKGLMSSEAGGQSQDGERKGHLMQLVSIIIALVIWWFGVPYLLKLGFK